MFIRQEVVSYGEGDKGTSDRGSRNEATGSTLDRIPWTTKGETYIVQPRFHYTENGNKN